MSKIKEWRVVDPDRKGIFEDFGEDEEGARDFVADGRDGDSANFGRKVCRRLEFRYQGEMEWKELRDEQD